MQLAKHAYAKVVNTLPMESAINAQQINMPRLKIIQRRAVSVLA
jgi:hypothetical protein